MRYPSQEQGQPGRPFVHIVATRTKCSVRVASSNEPNLSLNFVRWVDVVWRF